MAGHSRDIGSAYDARAVTKSDATLLPTTRGLYIGGAGDVAVTMASGQTPVVFAGALAGSILTIQVTQVLSTSTTATSIVALY